MNDPEVTKAAREFGNLHRTGNLNEDISKMFRIALGRPPLEHEISRSLEYLDRNDRNSQEIESKIASSRQNLDKVNIHISKITEPEKLVQNRFLELIFGSSYNNFDIH